jgi:hypothetical protein
MIKKLIIGVSLVPFLMLPAIAQEHHYQGGPKEVHHIGDMPGAKKDMPGAKKKAPATTTGQSQKGQHHYQGGPKEPHHIGDMPKNK